VIATALAPHVPRHAKGHMAPLYRSHREYQSWHKRSRGWADLRIASETLMRAALARLLAVPPCPSLPRASNGDRS
jgi:hypothetical protein